MVESFTPGPWAARKAHSGIWDVFDSQNRDVVTVSGGGVWPVSNEANARLIAACPTMLEALKETRTDLVVLRGNVADAAKSQPRWEGMSDHVGAWIARIDAAIALALSQEGVGGD